jgi:pseudaminic acid cytidylyltransferase
MKVAIIPARGGSKRIPRKNIRDFCGKPMIAWSIEVAKASCCFDRIIVSTDDHEIAEISRDWGAEAPFMRPAELADDHTGTTAVIAHAITWLKRNGLTPTHVCCIYATAPFVTVENLQVGLRLLQAGDWAFSFSTTEFPSPIYRAFKLHPEGGIEMFFPEYYNTRSQDLPIALHDAGQFYWGRADAWTHHKRIFDRHSVPLILPCWQVHDIDTEDDWIRAELFWKALNEHQGSQCYD